MASRTRYEVRITTPEGTTVDRHRGLTSEALDRLILASEERSGTSPEGATVALSYRRTDGYARGEGRSWVSV